MSNTTPGAARVAVVTGATRGMGFEAARQLLRRGYRVTITGRDLAAAEAAAATLRADGVAEAFQLDGRDEAGALRLAEHLHRTHGRVDVLINNAGAFFEPTDQSAMQTTSVFTLSPATLRDSWDNNAVSALLACQALVPRMRAGGYGRVVNVSSSMASLATMTPGWPGYRLSKLALNGITRLFAAELEGSGVKINSVCPGWVRTAMGGPHAAKSVEEGVDTTVWLATLPDDGPSGGFFQDRKPIPW